MIRFYLLAGLLLASLVSFGQGLAGYVLTPSGDTLRGFVREKGNGRVLFYPAASAAPRSFRATQLRGYGLTGNSPVYSRVVRLSTGADSVRFVLARLVGAATLYSYDDEHGLLLGTAATDTLHELSAQNWHLLLNRWLTGCASLNHTSEQMLQLPYSAQTVEQVIYQYNRCVQPQAATPARPRKQAWRQGIAGRLAGYTSFARWAPSAGLEWTALRASGLQLGLHLDYTYLSEYSAVSVVNNARPPVERRTFYQLSLASPTVSLGRRFGRPQRISLYTGAGLGFDFIAHSNVQNEERPLGSSAPFQIISSGRFGVGTGHLDACLGTILPLSDRQELRVSAVYRQYLSLPLSGLAGLQLAYYWYAH